jgi:hypothetical protein
MGQINRDSSVDVRAVGKARMPIIVNSLKASVHQHKGNSPTASDCEVASINI